MGHSLEARCPWLLPWRESDSRASRVPRVELGADPLVAHCDFWLVRQEQRQLRLQFGPLRRLAATLALGAALAGAQPASLRFVDVTSDSGLQAFDGLQGSVTKEHIIEVMGGGVAFLDYNADRNLDILLVRGSTIEQFERGGDLMCALYRGNGQGNFEDVTVESGLTARGWGQGVALGDFDSDGRIDFFLTGYGSNALYRNLGDGTFKEVARSAGIAESQWSLGASFSDVDRDGDLDLYVSNYLAYPLNRLPKRDANCNYRGFDVFCGPRGLTGLRDSLYLNDGRGNFEDVAAERLIDQERLYGLGVLVADYNNDSWPDIFVANDLTANLFYQNNGDGTFEELAVLTGTAFSQDGVEEGSMGVDVADIDQDGWLDLYYTNSSYESNSMLVNNGDGSFTNLTYASGHGRSTHLFVGWGVAFGDLDNDSKEDLFVVNGHLYPEADRFEMGLKYEQLWLVFMNQGNRQFLERGEDFGLTRRYKSRGLALGDYDNDGDLDVVVNNLDGPPTLLRNEGGNRNPWLLVDVRGSAGDRSAIGARVEATSGDTTQLREVRSSASYLSANDLRQHFGFGTDERVEQLTVRWPSGRTLSLEDVALNQVLIVEEPESE